MGSGFGLSFKKVEAEAMPLDVSFPDMVKLGAPDRDYDAVVNRS